MGSGKKHHLTIITPEARLRDSRVEMSDVTRAIAAATSIVASLGLSADDAVVLNESNRLTRLQWLAALDKIDALKPSAVVAGHKIPANDDSPRNVEETRQYIRNFIRLNDATKTSRELYDRMLELYPEVQCALRRSWESLRPTSTQGSYG